MHMLAYALRLATSRLFWFSPLWAMVAAFIAGNDNPEAQQIAATLAVVAFFIIILVGLDSVDVDDLDRVHRKARYAWMDSPRSWLSLKPKRIKR